MFILPIGSMGLVYLPTFATKVNHSMDPIGVIIHLLFAFFLAVQSVTRIKHGLSRTKGILDCSLRQGEVLPTSYPPGRCYFGDMCVCVRILEGFF